MPPAAPRWTANCPSPSHRQDRAGLERPRVGGVDVGRSRAVGVVRGGVGIAVPDVVDGAQIGGQLLRSVPQVCLLEALQREVELPTDRRRLGISAPDERDQDAVLIQRLDDRRTRGGDVVPEGFDCSGSSGPEGVVQAVDPWADRHQGPFVSRSTRREVDSGLGRRHGRAIAARPEQASAVSTLWK